MTENILPRAEEVSPAPDTPKKKKGYVRYSPLSLVLLAVCAFVFAFSMMGVLEQSVLDLAGSGMVNEILGFLEDENSGIKIEYPNLDENGRPRQWQKIAPTEIDPDKLQFLQVSGFDKLKLQNNETVAWMYWPTTTDVKGLPFNMPVVQTANNDFYLTHTYDKSWHANGWVYVDYRCDMEDLRANRNLIIYAHARSYQMFGGLRFLNTKTKWQEDGYNHFIYINTPTGKAIYQVFAWYETTTAHNYIDTYFSSGEEYVAFLNDLQSRNVISAFEKFTFTPEDRIITLSTCKGTNSDVRIAVHAVLVKYEKVGYYEDKPIVTQPLGTGQFPFTGSYGPDTDVATDVPTDGEVMPTDTPVNPTDAPVTPPAVTDSPPATSGAPPSTESPPATETSPPSTVTPPASSEPPPVSSEVIPPSGTSDVGTPTDTPTDSGNPSDTGTTP